MTVTQGINPVVVDTVQTFPLGTEVDDPRSQTYPGNKLRYVKAGSTITANDALKVKTDDADEPWTLIPTAAVAEVVVAIAQVTIASGSFGWVITKGRVPTANVGASIAAGAKLGSSASAGKLVALAQADSNFSSNNLNAAIAQAAGVGLMALDSNDSNAAAIEVLIS
jgi:hypothetical protein